MIQLNSIIITGSGGDLGISLSKIIRESGIAKKVIGLDIHSDHPGNYYFDECHIVPRATDHNYLKSLESLINKLNPDLIIPGSEVEIRFFTENNITKISSTPLLMANHAARKIGLDKYTTSVFLSEKQLPTPTSYIFSEDVKNKIAYPCIIKPRCGAGSKGIEKLNDDSDFNFYLAKKKNYLIQEYLLPDDQEYTCGLFKTVNSGVRHIIFKRTLNGDHTGKGEVISDSNIEKILTTLADAIELNGSINIQLRLTKYGPKIFEINPRFSSTVYFRHIMGFQDLIWSIQDLFQKDIESQNTNPIGLKFYRSAHEILLRAHE